MDSTQPKNDKGSLLLVDDDLSALQTMEAFLVREGYEVRCTLDGRTALMFAREDPPELILLDIRLQDTDGFEVCRRLKKEEKTSGIPVIFISALDEAVDKVKGFAAGGVDYITKPFQSEEVLARVETHLTVRRLQKKVEAQNAQLAQQIIKSKRAEEEIRQAAEEWRTTFDSITDLVSIHDKDFRIVRANQAFADAFGMEIRAVLGKKCLEVVHGTEEPWPLCPHRQTMESGKPVTEEFFEPRLGRYLQVSASPIWNDQNEVIGSVHIAKDITERKHAEEALQRAHDELEERVKERTADLAVTNEQLVVSEKALEERLKFESLLAEISGHFVNLPIDQIEDEIKNTQRRICEFLHLDRSTFWLVPEEDQDTMRLVHIHPASEDPPLPESMDARDFFPWSTQKVLSGEILTISKLADLPPEAARDRETWHSYGTKSTVVIPLSTGRGKPFGLLSFAMTRQEGEWPESVLKGFQLITQVFANALGRKGAEEALRASEERLSLAANSAGAILWSMQISTGQLWTNERPEESFGLTGKRRPTFDDFLTIVHPEERERIRQAVFRAIQAKEEYKEEYRLERPEGNLRWIASRGLPYMNASGEPDRLMGVSIDITERKRMEEQLKEHLQEIEKLKERLQQENIYLHEEIKLLGEYTEIVGRSLAMKEVLAQAEKVAPTESTVLLIGETGTGKELLARAIHRMSSRKDRPLVTVNCASLPPTLIESELFGREKGAYTGALTKLIGRFEIADGSTLFLDEIGEFPLELQSKLLRVIETGDFERLGSTRNVHTDVRIIAATNRDLNREVTEGKFRRDLFYRLNVFPIIIPPLRDRPEDIPLMVWTFVKEFQKRMGKEIVSISKKSMEALQSYSWPGNVRELRNVIEHAMIVSSGKTLVVHAPELPSSETRDTRNLGDMERGHIVKVLERNGWRVGGRGGAAEILGLKRSTLYSKMKKLGIHRPNS
jgi:formate hydrogenlyase transcriptional activator